MPLAFATARATRRDTRLHDSAEDTGITFGLAREDATGRNAEVAAVEAEADAASELLQIRLRKRGVRAGRAIRRALVTRSNAAHQYVERAWRGMGSHHVANAHVCLAIFDVFDDPASRLR